MKTTAVCFSRREDPLEYLHGAHGARPVMRGRPGVLFEFKWSARRCGCSSEAVLSHAGGARFYAGRAPSNLRESSVKADTLHSQLKGALCGFALAVALILAGATGASAQEMGSSHFPGLASANQVIAGPVTGAPSLPSARALVSADIPQNLTLGTLNIGANVGLPGTSLLMVNANTVAPPGFVSGSEYLIANFVAPNSDVGVIFFDTYGPASSTNPNCCFGGLAFRRADGTSSAPTPLADWRHHRHHRRPW